MPVYEYKCEKCGCEFEKRLEHNSHIVIFCPKCRACEVKKNAVYHYDFRMK